MRILVAGAGGFIGLPLCKELVRRKHEVLAFDRYFFGIKPDDCEIICGDSRNVKRETFHNVEAIIDLSGLSNDATGDLDPELTREINGRGGAALAMMAAKAGVRRYLYSSSASVYGHGEKRGLAETDRCHPQTTYAQSKLYAEKGIALAAEDHPGFEPVILRNATVFGVAPRMRFDLAVNVMTMRAWRDRVIYVMGGGEQWRPFIHIDDVVRAFVLCLEAPAEAVSGQIFNVGGDSMNHQVCAIAAMVREFIPDVAIHQIPDDPDKRSYHLSFVKIKEMLGFETMSDVNTGIFQIVKALETGRIEPLEPTGYTLGWYKALIEWEKRIRELTLDGRVL